MAKLKNDLAEFNTHFDNWFSETSLYEKGEILEVLAKMKELGYTYEADGATWLRTTDFKDDKDRVLIKMTEHIRISYRILRITLIKLNVVMIF